MCGRLLQITPPAALAHAYGVPSFLVKAPLEDHPRYNVAPSQPLLAVRLTPDDERELVPLTWGLIPRWSKEPKTPYSTINARAETVAVKPAFRDAFRHRRCLIPADGFYEWRQNPTGKETGKQPFRILAKDGQPLTFAGLWERWEGEGHAPIESCSIVVTAANAFMASIHDRMPAMLMPEAWSAWLDPRTDAETLTGMLGAWPDGLLQAYPVSQAVNSPRNDSPALLEPVAAI
jgi:putative SOS response-associated peptidase YedK